MINTPKDYYILGAGGFAREVAWVTLCNRHQRCNLKGYLSDDPEQLREQLVPTGEVIGSINSIKEWGPEVYFVPGIGSPVLREKLVNRALIKGWSPLNLLIHKQSFIGEMSLGEGSIVCSMCSITVNVKVGKYVNINLNCTIGHDSVLEDYVNLSPHCTISGNVYIGRSCDLGSAATVLPGITIGEGSVIGAGCVVTKDVEPYSLVVGVPGKIIKDLRRK